MHQLYFYSIVATFILTISAGNDGSSNRQSMMLGNRFMLHKSSSGKVYTIGSNGSRLYLTKTNSEEGNAKRMENEGSGSSFFLNGNSTDSNETSSDAKVPDSNIPNQSASTTDQEGSISSDGTTTDVPRHETSTEARESPSNQRFFGKNPKFQTRQISDDSDRVVHVSGGNGKNGADASQGGADGADGSIQVQD